MTPTTHTRLTIVTAEINQYNAEAIRQGASLAFLALELQEIKGNGAVAMAIREHLAAGQSVIPVVIMVRDQWRSGSKRELVRLFGKQLLRKILNVSL